MIPECPFFPGKKCFGTCSNHNVNVAEIKDLSIQHGVAPETVMVWKAISPFRFAEARIKSNKNDGFFEECENRLVN